MKPFEDIRLIFRACSNLVDTDSYIEWAGYADILGKMYRGMCDWTPEKMARLEAEIEKLRNMKQPESPTDQCNCCLHSVMGERADHHALVDCTKSHRLYLPDCPDWKDWNEEEDD